MARCPHCWRRLASRNACPQHDWTAQASAREEPDKAPVVAGYAIEKHLGRGGFADVWLASKDGEQFALKVARARTDEHIRRFDVEATALDAVGPVYGPGLVGRTETDSGLPVIVMGLAKGEPLADILAAATTSERGVLAPERARRLAVATARALAGVAEAGLVHADLKPENILVDESSDRPVTLIDFGIAQSIGAPSKSAAGLIGGSVEYIAPETLRGEAISAQTDLYSLGAIFFELATGRVPFVGDRPTIEYAHLNLRPPPPRVFADVDAELAKLALRCLNKSPDKRPSASVVAAELAASAARTEAAEPGQKSAVLGEAQKAVVLLSVESPIAPAWSGALGASGATLAREWPERQLWSFAAEADPVAAVLAVLAALSEANATVHVERLSVRASRRRVRVFGDAIEDPSTWLPPSGTTGVALTQAAAAVIGSRASPDPILDGFFRLSTDSGDQVALVGREDEISRGLAAIRTALESGVPTIVTLVGAPGTGKTRVAREVVAALEQGNEILEVGELAALGDIGASLRAQAQRKPIVVFADDAHRCDHKILDALEYAALDGSGIRLAVLVAATEELYRRRPRWSERGASWERIAIDDLETDKAMQLVARFLEPAEYLPADFLRAIAEWGGGNPSLLAELATVLVGGGELIDRGSTKTMSLSSLAPGSAGSAVEEWLVAQSLAGLPPEHAALARVAAVLGNDFDSEVLDDVLGRADAAGTASSPVAATAGLQMLAASGVLVSPAPGRWKFRRISTRNALLSSVDAEQRVALHRHVLDCLDENSPEKLAAIAEHAAGCGESARAFDCFAVLGARAQRNHRHVDAERLLSQAIELADAVGDRSAKLAEALRLRSAARYRVHRTDDSLADLERALALANEAGDRSAALAAHIGAALALDWSDRNVEQAAEVDRARAYIDGATEGDLARFACAEGRVHWRRGELEQAIERLGASLAGALSAGDDETATAAELLLAPALVFANRTEDAERHFEAVIDRCQRLADHFHLATALSNRSYLWSAVLDVERLLSDLDRAVELARAVGQPMLERAASHNLAEFLHWAGESDRAAELAYRAEALRDRFVGSAQVADPLLIARIEAARGDWGKALEWVATARASIGEEDPPAHGLLLAAVEAAAGANGGDDTWAELDGRELPAEERIELGVLEALARRRAGDELGARKVLLGLQDQVDSAPIWRDHLTSYT